MNAALRPLAEQGLLRAEEAGNAYLYTFNREHLGAPAIEVLAEIPGELVRRLRAQARTRLDNAQKSLEVAELAAAEQEIPASCSVAAALAVLSGIASVDAACCAALGRRSRGEDHREAAALLRNIVPGGDRAARTLIDLIM